LDGLGHHRQVAHVLLPLLLIPTQSIRSVATSRAHAPTRFRKRSRLSAAQWAIGGQLSILTQKSAAFPLAPFTAEIWTPASVGRKDGGAVMSSNSSHFRRGEKHVNAKLSDSKVSYIRKSGLGLNELAAKFAVDKKTIWAARTSKTLTHLPRNGGAGAA
jgi:hypothetical protein